MKGTILILSALLLASCSKKEEKAQGPTAFVSILPQAGLLKQLVGDEIEVRTLIGEGQSPHAYEPTARQLAALGEAELWFTIGVPYEKALLNKIKPLYPDLIIVESDEGITKRLMPHEHHGEACTHEHGEPDPHLWLSPKHCLTIVDNMYQALEKQGLADQEKYNRLTESLKNLDHQISEQLAPYAGSRFYVFHPSFGYFADQYGLEQVPIEMDGKSPSPRQLADLIEKAQADGVRVIFVQQQFPVDSASAVAHAIGGSVVQLNPLAEDVVANLERIAESIARTLEQE
jgi:zinc transport system substrate-binding protein